MPRLIAFHSILLAATFASVAAVAPALAVMPARSGQTPPTVSDAFRAARFTLPSASALGVSALEGTWKVPVILVDFTDQPLTYSSASEWDRALFDTTGTTPTGSVFDYYTWVSGSRLRVLGKVVATVHLEFDKDYYANNSWGLSSSTPQNSAGAVLEALRACDTQVDWSEYDRDIDGYVDMVWLLHSGLGGENVISRQDLWSITSRLSAWVGGGVFTTSDPLPGTSLKERVDAFTIVPEMSAFRSGARSEIGVFCHEFGHAIGLPDLYDTEPGALLNVGPGNWSLMSTGAYGTDSQSPEYPSHLGAWPSLFLGWKTTTRPTRDTTLTLAPLENGGNILELWFQGEAGPEHFYVENRQRLGFDRNLLNEGLLVYQTEDAIIRSGLPANRVSGGYRVVEGDGRRDLLSGINRGDAGDPFPGASELYRWDDDTSPNTRSIFGNITHVGLSEITPLGDDVRMTAHVRPRGWTQPRAVTGPGFQPLTGAGRGTRAVRVPNGAIVAATSEMVSGRAQIFIRTRRPDAVWEPPFQISQTSASATDPSLCLLPGGDLCVVWSDSRHGPPELYFRSRIGGHWTSERRLTDLPGFSAGPAVGADAKGQVQVAWLYNDAAGVRVQFMSFTYLSPFGDPVAVSGPGAIPDYPSLVMGLGGKSTLFWADRSTAQSSLWFSRFDPDSGVRPPARLTQNLTGLLPIVEGVTDPGGVQHLLWATSGPGGSELRYQKRSHIIWPDTAIARRGEPIQDFGIALSLDGGVHIAMEAIAAGATRILYKEWRPNGGWDVGSTEVTEVEQGVAVRPVALPLATGSVTMLYTNFVAGVGALTERGRNVAMEPLTGVADRGEAASLAWRVAPNPLRAGSALRVSGGGPPPAGNRLEVFDLSGRRLAIASVASDGRSWHAEVPAGQTRAWPSGVYFARFEGGRAGARIVVLR